MDPYTWAPQELVPLRQVAQLKGASSGTHAALYARIRRGTLFGVKVGQIWFIPRVEIRRLQRQAEQHKRKRPTDRARYLIDETSQELVAALPIPKRGRAALEAQAFLRGTIRARLRRMYPDLDTREITREYFRELAANG